VASARREVLLRAHRFRLRREDLEDCYSQATLELIVRARAGRAWTGRRHIANALEQRFLSRVSDRRRALAGRSPMQAALEDASRLAEGTDAHPGVADLRGAPEHVVMRRHELCTLEALARRLTADQRAALACQLGQLPSAAVCEHFGWSIEKYRKVAQRGRARLRQLMAAEDAGVPAGGGRSDERAGLRL
jgi:DNA-directed RNA polymerase specialized sigma24 family protein